MEVEVLGPKVQAPEITHKVVIQTETGKVWKETKQNLNGKN